MAEEATSGSLGSAAVWLWSEVVRTMSILSSCLRGALRGSQQVFAPVLLLWLLGWAILPDSVMAAAVQKRGGRGGYVVQLDAFASLEAAQVRLEALQAAGLAVYVVKSEVAGRGTLYRVRHGRFATPAKARQAGAALQSRGVIGSFFVAPYEPPLAWAPANAPKSNLPAPSSPPGPALAEEGRAVPPSAPSIRYQEVVDPSSGYSLQVPASWRGGMVSEADRQRKGIDAGATFQSPPDQAFVNVVWNGLPNAHQKESGLILAMILHGLRAGEGVKQMEEISRRVESTKDGIVRTHLELVATFQVAEGEPLLDFEGRAVVLQTPRGILLVSCFYGFDAPPETKAQVEHILASAKAL